MGLAKYEVHCMVGREVGVGGKGWDVFFFVKKMQVFPGMG